jgi:Tol biopolymer transport system component
MVLVAALAGCAGVGKQPPAEQPKAENPPAPEQAQPPEPAPPANPPEPAIDWHNGPPLPVPAIDVQMNFLGKSEQVMIGHNGFVSPDARHYADIQNAERGQIFLDNVPGKKFDLITETCFSPDSAHFAYSARTGDNFFLVLDGKVADVPGAGRGLCFSPDSRRFACVLIAGGQRRVFVDGVAGNPYYSILPEKTVFSPDSKRLAYIAISGGKAFIVRDGAEGKTYDKILCEPDAVPVFSPDSATLAYLVEQGGEIFLVMNEIEHHDRHSIPVFSPDSKHTAYIAREDGKCSVVVDDVAGKQYDGVYSLTWSPDGKHLAYAAQSGDRYFCVVDGVEGKAYDMVHVVSLTFSPDSKRLAYMAEIPQKAGENAPAAQERICVVVNGVKGKAYQQIGRPEYERQRIVFSADSKHLAYYAAAGNTTYIVVDGAEWLVNAVPRTPLFFDAPGHLRGAMSSGLNLFAAEIQIKE